MATLRKACRHCTTAKRKCVVQVPNCVRCSKKGLECTYDLEPLSAPVEWLRQKPPQFAFNPSTCGSPGYCIMKTLHFRGSGFDPAICRPGHDDLFELLRFGYLSVPDLVRAREPAVFIHPKLQLRSSYNHVSALVVEIGQCGASYEAFKHLTQIDTRIVPIEEALTALQALLIYLATFACSLSQVEQAHSEKSCGILSEWTQNLLTSAQARWPRNLPPWQEWLLAESVRRTIIMSYALSLAISGFRRGYCSDWLIIESLPFDRRAGLWMAGSPQAWIAASRAKKGSEVGECLSSFHEFAEGVGRSDHHDFCGDMFLVLLACTHNGAAKAHNLRPGGN
ncbi:hypothetical protein BX600DRAFT_65777 [Xylariales sp. PMI_506]|nr:hypothetical protein BX600DRAFT_65777 [Xylariales sp. PMI_506]